MPRTADELMNHHIESMINMKKDSNLEEALSDYSKELIVSVIFTRSIIITYSWGML